MSSAFGLGLFLVGIALLVFGLGASQSLAAELSYALSGSPLGRGIWLIGRGVLAVVCGLTMARRGVRRTRKQG